MNVQSQYLVHHSLLTSEAIELLTRTGMGTIRSFLEARSQDICSITGFSEDLVNRIKEDLSKILELQPRVYRQTGIKSLDDFLGGGLRVGHVYEICGPFEAGKSKFCQTLSLRLAQRGIGTFYVDLNGDLVPREMLRMLTDVETKESITTILKLIRLQRISDVDTLKKLLQFLIAKKSALPQFGFLVVDSIAHFHVLCMDQNRRVQSEKIKILGDCYKLMHQLAKGCNFSVLLTNLLLTNAEDSRLDDNFNIGLKIDELYPDLPFTRLRIEAQQDSAARRVTILGSSYIAENAEVSLQLTKEGFI